MRILIYDTISIITPPRPILNSYLLLQSGRNSLVQELTAIIELYNAYHCEEVNANYWSRDNENLIRNIDDAEWRQLLG